MSRDMFPLMKLALKHQVLLAPAVVLILMSVLLVFLQYTYWDLSVKRQQAKKLGNAFVAMAGANFTIDQLSALSQHLTKQSNIDLKTIKELTELHENLSQSINSVTPGLKLSTKRLNSLKQALNNIDPQGGLTRDNITASFADAKREFASLQDLLKKRRVLFKSVLDKNIDELVARTTFVAIIVLGLAILVGIFLSLYFSRNILRRISLISNGAAAILRGEYNPLSPPSKSMDELDDLAISINSMTDRLLRVVGAEKLLEGAEEERRRIAMELHDQTLADLSTILRRMRDLNGAKDNHALHEIENGIVYVISELRNVMDNLHPQTLDILGLSASIESYMETKLGGTKTISGIYVASGDVDSLNLSRIAALTLYRITIEAINNVVKHAHASRYETTLSHTGGELVVNVEDNGSGLPDDIFETTKGRGLHNMRERAKTIGADIAWSNSRFSSGTCVEIRFPYQPEKERMER